MGDRDERDEIDKRITEVKYRRHGRHGASAMRARIAVSPIRLRIADRKIFFSPIWEFLDIAKFRISPRRFEWSGNELQRTLFRSFTDEKGISIFLVFSIILSALAIRHDALY